MPETPYVPPPNAERTMFAALVLLAVHRPQELADLFERVAMASAEEAPERVELFRSAGFMLRRGAAPTLWTRIRGALGFFAASCRSAVLEADLEEEARELEEKAKRPESHGSRRGSARVGALVVFVVVVFSAIGLQVFADARPLRLFAGAALLVTVALLALDRLAAAWRVRRARALAAALAETPMENARGVVVSWIDEHGPRELFSVLELEPDEERVRVVVERRILRLRIGTTEERVEWERDPGSTAYRITARGELEREELAL